MAKLHRYRLRRFLPMDICKATPSTFDEIEGLPLESATTSRLYNPMPYDDSIRLVCISKGVLSDPVEVTLEFARLDGTTRAYEALSYVWGSSARVSQIVHQPTQTAISITRNLYDALKGVRDSDQDRVIWFDALCINQEDGKEKGIQVRKMTSIYARASRVIVWLGADEAGDADGAFSALCALARTRGAMAHYATRSPQHASVVPSKFVPSKDNYETCRKVMAFFCQTWYTRLWVLQEIVLAQDAVFIWGDCSISWSYVGPAIEAIQEDQPMRRLFETRNLQSACIMWRLSIVHKSNSSKSNALSLDDGLFPFPHLLDMSRIFQVTDPRDKIYGLLGLPMTNGNVSARSIVPDYTLSASAVYTQTTRALIENQQNLDALALILHTPMDSARH